MASRYVTTPLYYVNAPPHIGHAYTQIAADVWARFARIMGHETHFLTGTDEHGQKVMQSAEKRGMTPQEHVDDMVVSWASLWTRLNITEDDFIRTTEDRHKTVVQAVLSHLKEKGDIYAADYEGWYSTSEERFWTDKDLVDGKCPQSGLPVEWLKEKNYFFKMSKYADTLRDWIEKNPRFIQPESRKNEILGYLKKDVQDLCISRPKSRLPWGIEIPFDSDYVTYVWFDALLNYISALGYHPDEEKKESRFDNIWPATYQIVGKDILTTHAVYWSTMLFALGLKPTKTLYAHGWWTVEGRKMSKSLGNVIDPNLLLDNYGPDSLRYYMLKEFPFGSDGNFSHESFMVRYNADLANDFGNLAHRALSMTEKWLGGVIPERDENTPLDEELEALCADTLTNYTEQMETMQFSQAFETLWKLIRRGNKYIDTEQPWKLNREGQTERLGGVMRRCLEICRVAAWLMSPVLPNKSKEMLDKLGQTKASNLGDLKGLEAGLSITTGKPLFPRMKELPDGIQAALNIALGKPKKEAAQKVTQGQGKIKLKVFQKVPFKTGKITSVQDDNSINIDVGGPELVTIGGIDAEAKIGDSVIVAGPADKAIFNKISLKSAKILSAEQHPEADKLLILKVDSGDDEPRQIVAGIANVFSPKDLIGHKVTIVANLKPSKLRGQASHGMILAAGGDRLQALAIAPEGVKIGTELNWLGDGDVGLLSVRDSNSRQRLLTLSANCEVGAVVR